MTDISQVHKALDGKMRLSEKGGQYWMGRDIQEIFGYTKWDSFVDVISKAQKSCESIGVDPRDHFLQTEKMIEVGKGALVPKGDFYLTRYACYLAAMNGDPTKPEIAIAQSYFAVKTRQQEIQEQLTEEERRLQLRQRVKNANRVLGGVAKDAGVQRYGLFQNAGYVGLYQMGLAAIKAKKGIPQKEDLLDRVGRAELAANEFRITQTEERIKNQQIVGEENAIRAHREVGALVRATIKKAAGTMPEDLPAEPSIKTLGKKKTKELPSNG